MVLLAVLVHQPKLMACCFIGFHGKCGHLFVVVAVVVGCSFGCFCCCRASSFFIALCGKVSVNVLFCYAFYVLPFEIIDSQGNKHTCVACGSGR